MSNWMVLFVAGALEVCWAVGLKYTKGWTDAKASVLTLAAMVASMYLLGVATRTLPIGTAYAVWTGIGAIGTALLGMMLFGESSSAVRLLSIGLILAGIAGLKLTT